MTLQKKADCGRPQGLRKLASTQEAERPGGGKAVPVNEQSKQLLLPFVTAENSQNEIVAKEVSGEPASSLGAVPKANGNQRQVSSVTMEGVTRRLRSAFRKVASNKGAAGPDKQTVEIVERHFESLLPKLSSRLLAGKFEPGDIRRVWIPKPGGGKRGLGIPNVIDRIVQEAIRQVLDPLYDPTFHPASYGFRPRRGCHTAIEQAEKYLEAGSEFVVDIDLEKFFDKVCHQRLLSRLAQRINDKRVLVLIGKMLKAKVVMPDGVLVNTEEGVPQGGPLSPLLSNIVLDELDWELDRRGHRFVRYADDCNIYVSSERAGKRVMRSISRFIEGKLRLKVNQLKSAVARPSERHFLGFSLGVDPLEGDVEIRLSERSKKRIKQRIVELTPRNWGNSLKACIRGINKYLQGWFSHFGITSVWEERTMQALDAHIRRRLRAIQLAHWKTKRTIVKKLIKLGVRRKTAYRYIYSGRKRLWALSHVSAVDCGLRNAYFAERGLKPLVGMARTKLRSIFAPEQLLLPL